MWSFLEQTRLLLDELVKTLINLPESKTVSAKHNLTCRSIRTSQGIRKRTMANSTASNIPQVHVIDENGEFIPGFLTYLMEAILPMFKVLLTSDNKIFSVFSFNRYILKNTSYLMIHTSMLVGFHL